MTEDEAKTKWCPFARTVVASDRLQTAAHNRAWSETKGARTETNTPAYALCVASACMAWRGREATGFSMRAEAEFRRTGVRLKPEGADIQGYCGLAGAPQ